MINTSNFEEAKKLIKTENKPIIVLAQNDEFNRKILEYGKFDILLSIECGKRHDKIRQSDSGLNEILARIAHNNKVSIGINLEEIRNLTSKEKAQALGRIKQNIKLCRKTKTQIKLLNYTNKRSAMALLLSLGSSTQQAKEAISF